MLISYIAFSMHVCGISLSIFFPFLTLIFLNYQPLSRCFLILLNNNACITYSKQLLNDCWLDGWMHYFIVAIAAAAVELKQLQLIFLFYLVVVVLLLFMLWMLYWISLYYLFLFKDFCCYTYTNKYTRRISIYSSYLRQLWINFSYFKSHTLHKWALLTVQ